MLLQLLIIWNWTRVTLALWNAALWKPTFQSSEHTYGKSSLAVDGNKSTDAQSGKCAHTKLQELTWWMVDLQGLYSVKKVVVTNRKSYARDRLKNFRIEFFENDPREHSNFLNITGKICATQGDRPLPVGDTSFTCPQGIIGRFARLIWQHEYKQYLTICEFEVLVDSIYSRFIRYDKFIGKVPNKAFLTLTTDALWKCGWECSQRRDKELCMAVNWAPERRECRLISVDPSSVVHIKQDTTWVFLRAAK